MQYLLSRVFADRGGKRTVKKREQRRVMESDYKEEVITEVV